jgi:pre-mRNA-processing factor 8
MSEYEALSRENIGTLFSSAPTLIVDDSSFFRVTIQKSYEGNLTTMPINGAMFALDPKSGRLLVSVIERSLWSRPRRSKNEINMEFVSAFQGVLQCAQSMEPSLRPQKVVLTRLQLYDRLRESEASFSMPIVTSSLLFSFSSFLRVPKLSDIVLKADGNCSFSVNAYDNWLETISSYTAFSRLHLILRALQVAPEAAEALLRSENIPPNMLWPQWSDEKWIEIEKALKIAILDVLAPGRTSSLSPAEVRDMIQPTTME